MAASGGQEVEHLGQRARVLREEGVASLVHPQVGTGDGRLHFSPALAATLQ